jgi:hypothetical protein
VPHKPIIPVRFPPTLAATARIAADRDGMNLSAWIRHLIEQEIGRRDGVCPTCGHVTADTAEVTAARRNELERGSG